MIVSSLANLQTLSYKINDDAKGNDDDDDVKYKK